MELKERIELEVIKNPADREDICGFAWIDWNQLSSLGLIRRINEEVLHPLGLAMMRSKTGVSEGALVAPDGKWEYAKEGKKGGAA